MATQNITALRNELLQVFDGLRSGKVKPAMAKEINNTAGKVIGTLKVQLEFHKLTTTKPTIKFLEGQ